MFSKKRSEPQGQNNTSPAVTRTFAVTTGMWAAVGWGVTVDGLAMRLTD